MTGYRGAAMGMTLRYRTTYPVRTETEAGCGAACAANVLLHVLLSRHGKVWERRPKGEYRKPWVGEMRTTNQPVLAPWGQLWQEWVVIRETFLGS